MYGGATGSTGEMQLYSNGSPIGTKRVLSGLVPLPGTTWTENITLNAGDLVQAAIGIDIPTPGSGGSLNFKLELGSDTPMPEFSWVGAL